MNKFLDTFMCQDSSMRSVLFDGKAGIGKTYSIDQYFKNRQNYAYLSFFGIKSIEDVIVFLSDKIDSSYILKVNNKYIIEENNTEEWNGGVIIFDDLERKSPNISFFELEGLINSLTRNGFKVISIINSNQITGASKDKDLRKELSLFFEKTFDRKIYVTISQSSLKQILENNEELCDSVYLKIANDNLRLISRSMKYFKAINDYFKSMGKPRFIEDINLDPKQYFRCVSIAIRCIFSNNFLTKDFDKDQDFKAELYKSYLTLFNEEINVANEFYNTLYEDSGYFDNNQFIKDFVPGLITAYSTNNFDSLYNNYYHQHEDDILNSYPFNTHIYYLNDTENKKYKEAFLGKINSFDFSKEKQVQILISIIQYCLIPFSNDELNTITKRIIETVDKKNSDSFKEELRISLSLSGEKNYESAKRTIEKIIEKYSSALNEAEEKGFEEFINNKNYNELIDYLYEHKDADRSQKQTIEKILEEKDFLLPDLSQTIDYTLWSYCHEVTKFISFDEKNKKKFIEVFFSQYKKHPDSISLKDRFATLLKQYFNDNLDEYIKKNK